MVDSGEVSTLGNTRELTQTMAFAKNLVQLPKLEMTNNVQTTRTFTVFPKLPVELRTMIWGYASNFPRVVALSMDTHREEYRIEGQIGVPAILHVCLEARQEARKHYEICRSRCSRCSGVCTVRRQRQLYVNFAVDLFVHGTLWNRRPAVADYEFDTSVLERIQHLEIRHNLAWNNLRYVDFYRLFRHLASLRTLEFTVPQSNIADDDYGAPDSLNTELGAKRYADVVMGWYGVDKDGKTESKLPMLKDKEVLNLLRGVELGWKMEQEAEDVDLPPARADDH